MTDYGFHMIMRSTMLQCFRWLALLFGLLASGCAQREETGQIKAIGLSESRKAVVLIGLANGGYAITRLLDPRNCFAGSAIVVRNKKLWSDQGVRVCKFKRGQINNLAQNIEIVQQCEVTCKLPESAERSRLALRQIAKDCNIPEMDFYQSLTTSGAFRPDHGRSSGMGVLNASWASNRSQAKQRRYEAAFPCVQKLAERRGIRVEYPITARIM
jgi:hypothetical protein